ncbi:MAG: acyltransferase [Lachnospiraceae bacterium]|nr:acyltransferase [Lachnospiraceae bacterium]
MNQKKLRDSNIELLRIIAMLMIVGSHYACHGIQKCLFHDIHQEFLAGSQVNQIFTSLLNPGGMVGVGIFFMITGYFQINRDKFSIKKIVLETSFYGIFAVIAYAIITTCGITLPYANELPIANRIIASICLPATSGLWWFASAYIMLVIISPVLNKYLRKLSMAGWVLTLIVAWLLWYCLTGYLVTDYYTIFRAVFFYMLGGFFRLNDIHINKFVSLVVAIASWICSGFLNYIQFTHMYDGLIPHASGLAYIIDLILAVPITVITTFSFFKEIRLAPNSFINTISATTFGIYLIHESFIGRLGIWYGILNVSQRQYPSRYYPLMACASIIGVFAACSLIDFCRMKFIEPIQYKIVDNLAKKTQKVLFKDQ